MNTKNVQVPYYMKTEQQCKKSKDSDIEKRVRLKKEEILDMKARATTTVLELRDIPRL
jgi:hypothetical protein